MKVACELQSMFMILGGPGLVINEIVSRVTMGTYRPTCSQRWTAK